MKALLFAMLVFAPWAGASLSVSPTSIYFMDTPVGSFGPIQNVYVNNMGNQSTNVTVGAYCYGDFQVNHSCYGTLQPGMSCSIQVQFNPRSEGSTSCSISVSGSTGSFYSVQVSGRGVRR